jgi:hypothetical protein
MEPLVQKPPMQRGPLAAPLPEEPLDRVKAAFADEPTRWPGPPPLSETAAQVGGRKTSGAAESPVQATQRDTGSAVTPAGHTAGPGGAIGKEESEEGGASPIEASLVLRLSNMVRSAYRSGRRAMQNEISSERNAGAYKMAWLPPSASAEVFIHIY